MEPVTLGVAVFPQPEPWIHLLEHSKIADEHDPDGHEGSPDASEHTFLKSLQRHLREGISVVGESLADL